MRKLRVNLLVVAVLGAFASGCAANKPLPEPSLAQEAIGHTVSFERNMKLGRYLLALSDARKALDVSRILDRDDLVALSLNNLGAAQERVGSAPAAALSYREGIRISEGTGAQRTLAVSLNNLAGLIVETDPEKARDLASEALEIGRSRSWEDVMARALNTQARAALNKGDAGEALALCDAALEMAAKANGNRIRAAGLITRARIEAMTGDFKAAVGSAEEGLALDRALADPYAIALDHVRLAEIYSGAGDEGAAAVSREKAARIFRILGVEGTAGGAGQRAK